VGDPIVGTPAADRLVGTPRAERLVGLDGRDRINGRGGDDVLIGGPDGDVLIGGGGDDRIDARDREPARCTLRRVQTRLDYPPCVDVVVAGLGDDVILMRDGRFDTIWFCGAGVDRVIADPPDEVAGNCELVRRS